MDQTVGNLLLKFYVPKDLHHLVDNKTLDKKGIGDLFTALLEKHPEKYADVASNLSRLGFEVATRLGSSLTLDDLESPIDKHKEFKKLDSEISSLTKKKLGDNQHKEELYGIYDKFFKNLDKQILDEGVRKNKTLAKIVVAGSRGTPAQYRSTVATQGIVVDNHNRPMLDFPIKSSYAEGLTPTEYFVQSFGARAGLVSTKLAIAESGALSKELSRTLMPMKIEERDCGAETGISVSTSNKDYIGSHLAKPVSGHNRNNEVTSAMLADLRNKNIEKIIVRSPMTCQASKNHHFGAVCQMCAGKFDIHHPEVGSYIGMLAAGATGEPLSQGSLGAKHGGGAAKNLSGAKGIDLIKQFVEIPKAFKAKAAVATKDGMITAVLPAAGGGNFIHINNTERLYVPVDFGIHVKEGDSVEQGDIMSEGLVNPREIVQFKGIGEGRRYYAEKLHDIYKSEGMGINKRNIDLLARAAVDHVRIKTPEGLGNFLPEQIVSYQHLEKDYEQREGTKSLRPDIANGHYLEHPVLHYTIGTRIGKSVIKDLKEHNIDHIMVHKDPPHFEPEMVRMVDIPSFVPDWAHQLYSTYIERRLLNSVNTGVSNKSSLKGPSPIMGIAHGKDFALNSRL